MGLAKTSVLESHRQPSPELPGAVVPLHPARARQSPEAPQEKGTFSPGESPAAHSGVPQSLPAILLAVN